MKINYRNKFLIKDGPFSYIIYKPQRDGNGHKVKDEDGNQVFSPNKPMYIVHFYSLCHMIFIPNLIKTKRQPILDMAKQFRKIRQQIEINSFGLVLGIPEGGLVLYDKYLVQVVDGQLALQRASIENGNILINKKGKVVYGTRGYFKQPHELFVKIYQEEVKSCDATCVEELDKEVVRIGNNVLEYIKELGG